MNKYTIYLLKLQCQVVGANYDDIDFTSDNWYHIHEWTKEQEEEFKKLAIYYLNNNKDARTVLMKYPLKRNIPTLIDEWCYNYGWKYKNED